MRALVLLVVLGWADGRGSGDDVCEPITVPLCSDSLYNLTALPNSLGHMTQEKIQEDLEHYAPLIKIECSSQVKFFICSLFVPMCSPTLQRGITSCRSVCEEVHDSCIKTLKDFGFNWPSQLNCSLFPDQSKGEVCMHQPESDGGGSSSDSDSFPGPRAPRPASASCPPGLVGLEPGRCAPLCGKDVSFAAQHKAFAEIWMGVWGGACAVVTAATVFTCLIDKARFKFPERSIIYLALCYALNSWAYIARLIIGPEESSCATLPTGEKYLISGGLENVVCVVMFMVTYYFWVASQMWWVVLSLSWFLAARKAWGMEAIEALSSYFHLAAWGIPAVLSIAVLVGRLVDASELSGLCLVGNTDPIALAAFLIAPQALSLLLGLALNLGGFCGLHSVRSGLKLSAQTRDLAKLERLMTRIGVFSLLYVIPSSVLIACFVYHFLLLWDARLSETPNLPPRPNVQLHMLQIFMTLIVGITSGVWVFSRKTLLMWERAVCCGRGPLGQKAAATPLMDAAPLVQGPPSAAYPPPSTFRLHSASSYSSAASRKLPHSAHYHPIHAPHGTRL